MNTTDQVWREAKTAQVYLEGVRGAMPLAAEQIDIMLRLIRAARPNLRTFLDLGCGDGVLGHAILDAFPDASGVFVDFSEPMLAAARRRLQEYSDRVTILQHDYGQPDWRTAMPDAVPPRPPFSEPQPPRHEPLSRLRHPLPVVGDGERAGGEGNRVLSTTASFSAIVSGLSIHHQPNPRKRSLYRELFDLLEPGGILLNLEHVASASPWIEGVFDDYFIDALFAFHRRTSGTETRDQVAHRYYHRDDKAANILERVELQCDWLREIGFTNVDCFLKAFEVALFGGVKPPMPRS